MKDYRIRKETTKSSERFIVEGWASDREWQEQTWALETIEEAKKEIDNMRWMDKEDKKKVIKTEIIEY